MFTGLMLVTLVVAHPDLDEGRVAVSAMKYRPAVAALTKVTADAAATDAEVVEAFGLLAKAQLGLKKPELAQAAFEGLLQRVPCGSARRSTRRRRRSSHRAPCGW